MIPSNVIAFQVTDPEVEEWHRAWQSESGAFPTTFGEDVWAKLTCGHFAPIFEQSSDWDVPGDPVACLVCDQLRQFDLSLQVKLYEQFYEEGELSE